MGRRRKGGRSGNRPSPILQRIVYEYRSRITEDRRDYDGFLSALEDICFSEDLCSLPESIYWYHYWRQKIPSDRRRNAGIVFRRW